MKGNVAMRTICDDYICSLTISSGAGVATASKKGRIMKELKDHSSARYPVIEIGCKRSEAGRRKEKEGHRSIQAPLTAHQGCTLHPPFTVLNELRVAACFSLSHGRLMKAVLTAVFKLPMIY